MLKTLCAMLIATLAAASAHAQARFNNMDPQTSRMAARSIMQRELRSKPRLNDRLATLRSTYLEHTDRQSSPTQLMYEATRQLISEEAAQKTAQWRTMRVGEERQALSTDIRLLNEALRIYDFTTVTSSSRSAQSKR